MIDQAKEGADDTPAVLIEMSLAASCGCMWTYDIPTSAEREPCSDHKKLDDAAFTLLWEQARKIVDTVLRDNFEREE